MNTMFDGAFLIDKPPGLSSHSVVARVRKKLGIKKVGHAGTLDPLATGLLLVLCGRATRLQGIFLDADKSYSGVILLGRETSTDDLEGETVEEDPSFSLDVLEKSGDYLSTLKDAFTGTIEQIPPKFSAIKVNGERSYKRARAGENVVLQARSITIHNLDIERIDSNRLSYCVHCSKGTYIRSLARDVGRYLNTFGTLESIRRVGSTPFSIANSIALDEFMDSDSVLSSMVPIEKLVAELPRLDVAPEEMRLLRNGVQAPLRAIHSEYEGDLLALFSDNGSFSGLLHRSEGESNWKVRFLM